MLPEMWCHPQVWPSLPHSYPLFSFDCGLIQGHRCLVSPGVSRALNLKLCTVASHPWWPIHTCKVSSSSNEPNIWFSFACSSPVLNLHSLQPAYVLCLLASSSSSSLIPHPSSVSVFRLHNVRILPHASMHLQGLAEHNQHFLKLNFYGAVLENIKLLLATNLQLTLLI